MLRGRGGAESFQRRWRGVDIACRLPNGVTIYGGMHPQSRFSLFAVLLLLICSGNLLGVGLTLWRPNSDSEAVFDKWGTMAMLFLACNQVLYLIFFFAWLFEWIRFFPGNPVQTAAIYSGFSLSAAAFVAAFLWRGSKASGGRCCRLYYRALVANSGNRISGCLNQSGR
jgi:hypothetical protein